VILHRLVFGEIPVECTIGTLYSDGLRDQALFENDYLYERDGVFYRVPEYSNKPDQSHILLEQWYELGGTGRFRMNRSSWSAHFGHGIVSLFGVHHMKRSRFEWLMMRALAPTIIMYRRVTHLDDCSWIDGIDEIEDDTAQANNAGGS
jgi:hypothetical protein